MRSARKDWLWVAFALLPILSIPSNVEGWKEDFGWNAFVTGNVFCDQCQQNNVFPFGEPLHGAKVTVQCWGGNGKLVSSSEATTDFLGGYVVTFKGASDLGGCKAFVTYSPDSSCNIADGGGNVLSLKSKFFFEAFYFVDTLFYKPAQPKSFCPHAHTNPPPLTLPPVHHSPPAKEPPHTCTCENWLSSKLACHLKLFSPWNVTIGFMFGPDAEKKYGTLTLYNALKSEDNLAKQTVAAMLNSYSTPHWYYTPASIISYFLEALKGSPRAQTRVANRFARANTGFGKGKCSLAPCPKH